jgi:transcription termination/antitermination protein NusG
MSFQWYVVHTLSGHENKVKESIETSMKQEEGMDQYIKTVLVPTENVSEVKSGKKTIRKRKFFPGYILLEMEMTNEAWHFINNINGVIGFVGGGNKPVPLKEQEVNEILKQVEEKQSKVKPKVAFEQGEGVKVIEGPFLNFAGVVHEINPEKGKLKVMVTIFGRETPIELEYWQVEKV